MIRSRQFSAVPSRARRGFTLIEIMIVVAIMGIFLAVGIPSILRTMKRNNLTTAVQNVIDGCAFAREMAIFRGIPHEFVIHADRSLTVEQAKNWSAMAGGSPAASSEAAPAPSGSPSKEAANYKGTLTDTVFVDALAVNFVDMNQTETDAVRVRFHPNGTSDEFTILLNSDEGQRLITLDIVTGKPILNAPR
ncbi:MAG TPA: GspH/FimT family pseudopilin [Methylomirabilota bacterium]|nr:GspH/FimT family pseudopilin [Methylomirabilota bacterium]